MAEVNKIKKVKKDEKRLTDNWGYYKVIHQVTSHPTAMEMPFKLCYLMSKIHNFLLFKPRDLA